MTMTNPILTDEQLAEIRVREQAATPGPWEYDGMHNEIQAPYADKGFWLIISELSEHPGDKIVSEHGHIFNSDFDFAAHARQDIPLLLDDRDYWKARAETAEVRTEALKRAIKSNPEFACSICIHKKECDECADELACTLVSWKFEIDCALFSGRTRGEE